MVDWAATGQMLSGIGTLAGAIAIVLAAILGRNAVADFRRQKQVERQIEHAEAALAVAYRLQSAISAIRSPLSTASELASSREELESQQWFTGLPGEAEQSRYVQTNVFYQRIRFFAEDYDRATAQLPVVKAYFGQEASEALEQLIKARHTVRVYADAYAKDRGHDRNYSLKVDSFIWEGAAPGEEDPVQSKVESSIAALERHLLPVIRDTSTGRKLTPNG